MPGTTNALANFEAGHTLAESDDIADDLMAWDNGEGVREEAVALEGVRVADGAGQHAKRGPR